ncbi:MAG: hypothetical protein JW891_01780, partial [Candidatus Lokiarchaeota archaeon]|nr:hypothetical protein [Candidatus Lokiarchaeota archaeon]
ETLKEQDICPHCSFPKELCICESGAKENNKIVNATLTQSQSYYLNYIWSIFGKNYIKRYFM